MGVIRVYGQMYSRLQARESMLMVERLAVGTGAMKASDQRPLTRKWREEAGGTRQLKTPLPKEQLGSIGIRFTKVPAKKRA